MPSGQTTVQREGTGRHGIVTEPQAKYRLHVNTMKNTRCSYMRVNNNEMPNVKIRLSDSKV
jgi:hypothetical protein